MGEKIYTLPEISKICKTSVQTLRHRIKDGTLIANKYTREYLVTESNFNSFMKNTQTDNIKAEKTKKKPSKSVSHRVVRTASKTGKRVAKKR